MTPAWFPDTITRDLIRGTRLTLSYGLEGIVLRDVDGGRVPDVNIPQIEHHLRETELDLVAIEPGLFEGPAEDRVGWWGDLSLIDDSVRFCRRLKCPTIVVGALAGQDSAGAVEGLRRAAEHVVGTGIELVLRNEGQGRMMLGELAGLIQRIDRPSIRICWDPVSSLEAGESLEDSVRMMGDWLGLVVVRADGADRKIDWKEVFSHLHALRYSGPVVLDAAGLDSKKVLSAATEMVYALRSATTAGANE